MSAAVKICGLEEWAREVTSGSSIAVGGFGFSGVPFELLGRIAAEGEAQRLTLVTASCSGEDCGIGSLIARGMVDKVISAFVAENRVFSEAFHDGCFCLELCPMGTLVDRLTAGGTGMKAFYTTTGVGTVLVNGGVPQRYSSVDKGVVTEFSQPRETRLIDGEWCCMDTALKTDVALIKAWKGDKHGNLIFHATARNFNIAAAKSAKLCVAQVEELVECGELDPNFIHLPGVYVHCLVCVPHPFTKIEHLKLRDAGGVSPEQHESPKCRMARRAALEVEDGMVVNLGVGTPTLASSYIPESRDVVVMAGNGLMGIGRFPLNQEEVDPDVLNASKQTVTVNRAVGPCFLDFVDAMGITRGGHVDLALVGASGGGRKR
ncbi:3-oxoacid CoA-transferase [Angomonas deanei]|nr:3-oxoacid CoA-transferase [Angomonas deanei]|eukprot:EPY42603.1 3-oxoacid CoA-transferase [Angomonas deanei]